MSELGAAGSPFRKGLMLVGVGVAMLLADWLAPVEVEDEEAPGCGGDAEELRTTGDAPSPSLLSGAKPLSSSTTKFI